MKPLFKLILIPEPLFKLFKNRGTLPEPTLLLYNFCIPKYKTKTGVNFFIFKNLLPATISMFC